MVVSIFLKQHIPKCLVKSLFDAHQQFSFRYITSGMFYPKLPLNFIGGKSVEAEDELEKFSVEEPATGWYDK